MAAGEDGAEMEAGDDSAVVEEGNVGLRDEQVMLMLLRNSAGTCSKPQLDKQGRLSCLEGSQHSGSAAWLALDPAAMTLPQC